MWVLLFCCAFCSEMSQFLIQQGTGHSYSRVSLSPRWQCFVEYVTGHRVYRHSLIHMSNHISSCFQNMACLCWLLKRSEFTETSKNQKGLEVVRDEREKSRQSLPLFFLFTIHLLIQFYRALVWPWEQKSSRSFFGSSTCSFSKQLWNVPAPLLPWTHWSSFGRKWRRKARFRNKPH